VNRRERTLQTLVSIHDLPREFVAIAEAPDGNVALISLKVDSPGTIWIWIHDVPEGRQLFKIADDFTPLPKALKCDD
jgi:SMI1-KNR4 cell-wall